eukprot:TRINITY_DN93944_c0_g1_i1.p1 TRINITY_DN93944_c0_g1~~TRINITY_DN93944_c0_g1_i1.p1  ORF type:complete len:168 (-),score=9.66 TRINITY_DN93944_c0_g1_i1:206-679(-)
MNFFGAMMVVQFLSTVGALIFMITAMVNFGINGLFIWYNPDTVPVSQEDASATLQGRFTSDMIQSYAFFATAWFVPMAFVHFHVHSAALRRKFCQYAAVMWVLWWPMWSQQIFVFGWWRTWVLALFIPIRAFEALGYLYLAFVAPDNQLFTPKPKKL